MNYRQKFPPNQYPFSDALCSFWDYHPEAFLSLKLNNTKRFELLPVIFTSHTPFPHRQCNDQVIGLWYLDFSGTVCKIHKRICWFKQDFIVNINEQHKEFVSYSANNKNGKFVKTITDFFNSYSQNGKFYHDGKNWQHHYSNVEDLPNEPNLRILAKQALLKRNIINL